MTTDTRERPATRRARPGPAGRRRWRSGVWAYVLLAPTLVPLAVLVGYPVGSVFVESLFDVSPLRHQGWWFAGLDNYVDLLEDDALWRTLVQTAIWTGGSVLGQLLVALPAAVVLREAFRGRGLLRVLLLVPWAIPAVVGAMAWKWMYNGENGLVNGGLRAAGLDRLTTAWLSNPDTALPAVVVANIWRGFPFIMIMLLAGLVAIPDSVYEAALTDGASYWQRLRHITLPLLRPALVLSTVLGGLWTFNNFATIYILTGGGPAGRTDILVTFVYENAFENFEFGYAAALSVVLFGLVFVVSLAYIRLVGREMLR